MITSYVRKSYSLKQILVKSLAISLAIDVKNLTQDFGIPVPILGKILKLVLAEK